MKLSEEELQSMVDIFGYSNLMERYKVLEEYFDIEEGSTVIDGGAFHGDMSIYFSKKVGDTGRVYAFEPMPLNVRMLKSFVAQHNLKNVRIMPAGLWHTSGKIPFYLSSYPNAGSLLKDFRKVNDQFVMVSTCALDDVLDKIDYVWMNIEASEINAIKGMERLLKNNDVKLCISTHTVDSDGYVNTEDVMKTLENIGYNAERVRTHRKWIYAEKK